MGVRGLDMGKYLASLAFVGCTAFASPLAAAPAAEASETTATVAVQHVKMPRFRDEAAMVLVGTGLIGLAAAVRRRTV